MEKRCKCGQMLEWDTQWSLYLCAICGRWYENKTYKWENRNKETEEVIPPQQSYPIIRWT